MFFSRNFETARSRKNLLKICLWSIAHFYFAYLYKLINFLSHFYREKSGHLAKKSKKPSKIRGFRVFQKWAKSGQLAKKSGQKPVFGQIFFSLKTQFFKIGQKKWPAGQITQSKVATNFTSKITKTKKKKG